VTSSLVAAYQAALAEEARATLTTDGLEERLAALCARGREAHPSLLVDDEAFIAHLARCGAPVTAEAARIFAEDLFIAFASLQGDASAIAALRALQRPVLAGYLRRIDGSKPFVDDIEQRMWDGALVGTAEAPPKLATYAGGGPLAGWLGISAQRLALMLLRHEGAEGRAHKGAAAEVGRVAVDPELAFVKGQLRDSFQTAVSKALESLGDRERMIYRMHLIDGLALDRIAKVYGVSQSTVSRWLTGARETVMTEAQRLLHERGLSPKDFESVAGLMVSQLDLSVSRILRRS
jgi:RNA polymerase sigma-70 factor (ECF subfamily)